LTRRVRRRVLRASEATIRERVTKVGMRLGLALLSIAVFAVVSLTAFLAFDWPPLFRRVAATYLVAVLVLRLILVVARVVLAPLLPSLRLLPLDDGDAMFWYRRLALFLGTFLFGWATFACLMALGADRPSASLVAYGFGLGMLGIAVETVWTRRRRTAGEGEGRHTLPAILLTVYFVALWLLWFEGIMKLFWLLAVAGVLPAAIRVAEHIVKNLLRPAEEQVSETQVIETPSVLAAIIERGARVLLIIAAALVLAWGWDVDLISMAQDESPLGRLTSGLLNVVVIVLLADFGWHVGKTVIDRVLHRVGTGAGTDQEAETEETRRRARLRTLLPIARNMMFVLVLVSAGLMGLSALGVQIGPLLAGAGVVGVAVGFGSQTLVKDIIAGVFFLLDDAFRVGEYIQSGSYKGTVESFSLRSVKLRHHRGPLYTVPFGSLGAIQNLSRDWVIDKIDINVTYDTDLDKLKKVIKQVSREFMEDPEYAKVILEPLKSQGVYQMGDFAIRIRMKIMTKPGEQFVVRRVIYDKIKKAFTANGINFALPTVTVAGGVGSAANGPDLDTAIAQQGFQMTRPPAEASGTA
jgi:small-conductance mechanosensitive channel